MLASLDLAAYAKYGGSPINCSGTTHSRVPEVAFQECKAFALAGDERVEVKVESVVFATPAGVRSTSAVIRADLHPSEITVESDSE